MGETAANMAKEFSMEEVAKHNTGEDLWVVIDGGVYDLSRFALSHPGGTPPLLEVAGQECTEAFYGLHRSSVLAEPKYQKLKIGTVLGGAVAKSAPEDAPSLPYAESMGTFRKVSPYYKASHHSLRAATKAILSEHVAPGVAEQDEDGKATSDETNLALGKAGLIGQIIASEDKGPALLKAWGIELPGGLDADEHDAFHGLIESEELIVGVRGCYGVKDGLLGGCAGIGLPPLIKFGSAEMIENFARPVVEGHKRIALAISEPYAGSDVSKIHTKAVLDADGNWLVTGVKKWITGGMVSDYFTTLVQTKEHGFCMMLIERGDGDTVDTRPIKTSYSAAAGTSYVTFEEAVVPPANVIGQLGQGFYQTMANFNFERWSMVCGGNRHSRLVVEEGMKWALQRDVFGKKLMQQPVIRFKFGQMIAEVETVHSLLEDITFQMTQLSENEINKHLAGPIALLKYKQSRTATMVADNACQVFGGRAITRTGMGNLIEKFQRSFKMMAILGGSEEIMCDFAMRQAMREAGKMQVRL